MRIIGIGMHEPDGDRFITTGDHQIDEPRHVCLFQWQQDIALRAHPFMGGEPMLTRDKRRGQFEVEIILLEPVFRAHFDHITKAFGGDKGGLGPAPFDQRIGDQRGAMDHLSDPLGRDLGRRAGLSNAVENGLFGIGVIGQHLGRGEPAGMVEGHIGEGAADIDADANVLLGHVTGS